jgi:hypothetical protein
MTVKLLEDNDIVDDLSRLSTNLATELFRLFPTSDFNPCAACNGTRPYFRSHV